MSLASKTRPISHALCDERSRQARWSLETGFAKSTGSSCNSPRLGIWLLTSGEPYPMRIRNFSFPLPTSQAIHGMIQHGLAVETPHLWSPVGCEAEFLPDRMTVFADERLPSETPKDLKDLKDLFAFLSACDQI